MSWLRRLIGARRGTRLDMTRFRPVPQGGILVGGAVRDALLGRTPADLDWLVPDPERAANDAAAQLQGSAFALDESRRHYRVVSSGRLRDYLPLDSEVEADLRARDYTVNAMAAGPDGRLIDPTSGFADLRAKRLRMVSAGNLAADPLRPLRGARLSVELAFSIEIATAAAIKRSAQAQLEGRAPLPAWERSGDEINKMLLGNGAAAAIRLLLELELLAVYLPELAQTLGVDQQGRHHTDVFNHLVEALKHLVSSYPEADLPLRWATLLHDVGKPTTAKFDETRRYYRFIGHEEVGADIAGRMLRRLRLPSSHVAKVRLLVRRHMLALPADRQEARRFVHRYRDLLPDLVKLKLADRDAKERPLTEQARRRADDGALELVLEELRASPRRQPLLSGDDVMQLLDLDEGPEVGEALRYLHEAEAVGEVAGRDDAIAALKRFAALRGWVSG